MLLPDWKEVYFYRIFVHNVNKCLSLWQGLDSSCHETGQWLLMGQSACLWSFPFDFGHLFSQVPCSLVGKVGSLGDRTVCYLSMQAITKFNRHEKLNGNKKDKTTVKHITSSQWRNSLGNALNRRNRGIVTILILPLVSSPGCPLLIVWKAVSPALKASILSSRSLGYSGNCLSPRLIRCYNLPVLVAYWRTMKLIFASHREGSASVWSGLSWIPKRFRCTTTEQKLPTLSILIPVRISNIILLHTPIYIWFSYKWFHFLG